MPKRPLTPIDSGRIILRPLEEADLPLTFRWRNQVRVREQLFTSRVLTAAEHRAWFESYRERDDDFVFVILDRNNRARPVGQAALYRVDWQLGCAEFGRLMIGEEDALGKGFASEATQLILTLAFKTLGLSTIHLEVFSNNSRAMRLYMRLGFVIAGDHDSRVTMKCRALPC